MREEAKEWGVWIGDGPHAVNEKFSSKKDAEDFVDRLIGEDLDHQNIWLRTWAGYVRLSSIDKFTVDEY